jgi:hypothetical protein
VRLHLKIEQRLGHLALTNMFNLLYITWRTTLQKQGKKLSYKALTPLSSRCCPEIDVCPELGEDDVSCFHSLVGVLRWIIDLQRVDINVEVSMMSSHLALP